jgi:hypothetical protein
MPGCHRHAAALTVLLALVLSACGGEDRPERATTLPDATATAPSSSENPPGDEDAADTDTDTETESETDTDTSAPDSDDAPDEAAGRLLTAEEARAALPTVADLPTGWSVDPEATVTSDGDEGDDSDTIYEPAACRDIFDSLDTDTFQDSATEENADFSAGALGPFLGVTIASYDEAFPEDTFSQLVGALAQCPEFTTTDTDGTTTDFSAQPLSFPNLGDETVALRLNATSEELSFGFDLVGVRVGNNVITLGQIAVGGAADASVLEDVARGTLERLAT